MRRRTDGRPARELIVSEFLWAVHLSGGKPTTCLCHGKKRGQTAHAQGECARETQYRPVDVSLSWRQAGTHRNNKGNRAETAAAAVKGITFAHEIPLSHSLCLSISLFLSVSISARICQAEGTSPPEEECVLTINSGNTSLFGIVPTK